MTEKPDQNSPKTPQEKLEALRAEMAKKSVEGYLVPRADEFQGEYVPASAARLGWLTDFTGSAGMAIILKGKAAVYSDGRYTEQLDMQVDGGLYERQTGDAKNTPTSWIEENVTHGDHIGYDPRLHTIASIKAMQKRLVEEEIDLIPVEGNLVDKIWDDRPDAPHSAVTIFDEKIAGKTSAEKRAAVADEIKEKKCYATVLTMPDSIAWLLNIRGNDVPHVPVALSYAFVREGGAVDWFIDEDRLSPDVKQHLGNSVTIRDPEDLSAALADLATEAVEDGKPVLLDENRVAVWFKERIEAMGAKIKYAEDPCVALRAIKTEAEQNAIREVHIQDGAALAKFLRWIDEEVTKGGYNELDIEEKLLSFRQEIEGFADTSFDTIAGWAGNGAVVHYRATEKTSKTITPPGILLVDSGMQNSKGGTTDITRTVAVGKPTAEMVENFTLVLQGHIAVAKQKFPKGVSGVEMDAYARQALWSKGRDYAHGTGHGVGAYLSVHEAGTGIHKRATTVLEPGMFISNEPGYYKSGEYGIRIENLVLVQEDGVGGDGKTPWYGFETVSFAPIDLRLVNANMLTDEELSWLNDYHEEVYTKISPLLDADTAAWLKQTTQPLKKSPELSAENQNNPDSKTPGQNRAFPDRPSGP